MVKEPSGKFVLRLPSKLHGSLKNIAAQKGVSLNELCRRIVESYVVGLQVGEGSSTEDGQHRWLDVLRKLPAGSILGVILFGSTARGESHSSSDIDLLIVLTADLPVTRSLYALWDENLIEERYSPHFVHLPESISTAGSLWFEAALDGIVLNEQGRSISRFLGRIRRKIASGGLERKIAYGQPYWINKQGDGSDVQ